METKLKFNNSSSFEELFNKSIIDKNVVSNRFKIDFDDALNSVDMPNILFNNYLESKKSPMTTYFRKQYYKIINNEQYDLLNDYQIIPVKGNAIYRKISKIVKETSNLHYDYDQMFFRLKNFNKETNFYNPGLQFYYIQDGDKYKVIIIDLYHMVIPAHNHDYHDMPKNPQENYDNHKNGIYNLSNFKKNS